MPEQPGGEKTLPASARKRQQAREKGNVPKSQDLNAALMMLVALMGLLYLGPYMLTEMLKATRHFFMSLPTTTISSFVFQTLSIQALYWLGRIVAPMMLLMLVAGIAVNTLQVGFLFAPQALTLNVGRLNPLTGLGRFFTVRAVVDLTKSILKLVIISWLVYLALRDRWEQLLLLTNLPPIGVAEALGEIAFAVWWRVVLAMIILGIFDFGFQRWQYGRDLMMTQREAREETKEMEGDPRIKQRIRQIQRQMAMKRMMKEVPKADVVITNPTHYAIALRYDPASMQAPMVVAKGARLLAARIRELAVEHSVPIIEKPELARALYRAVDIGGYVPEQLFRAVAEVLAFVYRIDRRIEKVREREALAGTQARRAAV